MTDINYPPLSIVDLHSHLVPGVDDGTVNVAESLAALSGLYAEGVRLVVTTPHLLVPYLEDEAAIDRELDRHRRAFETLSAALVGKDHLPSVALGQEILAPDVAAVQRIGGRRDVGLAGGRFLLVEFGFELQGSHNDVVRAVQESGRQIVIAHPERYRYIDGHNPIEVMRTWQDLGALLQVNVGSLTGHYNRSSPGSEGLAWQMIEQGLVDLLATDHHGPRRSGVSPREALDALIARGELGLAERAMSETPGLIARNETVSSRLSR
jgi:protein-tyrosine phosphatase